MIKIKAEELERMEQTLKCFVKELLLVSQTAEKTAHQLNSLRIDFPTSEDNMRYLLWVAEKYNEGRG